MVDAGVSPPEAKELMTAYMINENTKSQSVREDVMAGFGSNGGEELISYLMTGESILMQGGTEWKSWYETMSKKIITIQKKKMEAGKDIIVLPALYFVRLQPC